MGARFRGSRSYVRFTSFIRGKRLAVAAALFALTLPAIVRADDAPSLPSYEGATGGGSGGVGADASMGTATASYPVLRAS